MSEISTTKLPTWEFFFVILCTMYFIIPESQIVMPFFGSLFLGLAYLLFLCASNKIKASIVFKFIFGISLVAFLCVTLNDSSSVGHDVANRGLKRFLSKSWQYSGMFFPLSILYRTIFNASLKQKKIILAITLICALLSIKTILDLIAINPLAARNFGYEKDVADVANFIAPYPFVYGMTFYALLFYVLGKQSLPKKKMFKYISFGLFAFFAYFLIKSQFTLALLTTFVSIMYMYYKNTNKRDTKVIIVLATLLTLFLMPLLLDFIISISPEMLAQRFGEMKDFFDGKSANGDDSDLMGRFMLYGKSIEAFLSSPLYGNRTLDFYGHATFLTIPADLGLLGAIPIFTMFVKAKKIVQYTLGNFGFIFVPFFFHLFIMGFTNPIHASLPIDYLLWFIVPLTINTFSNNIKTVNV